MRRICAWCNNQLGNDFEGSPEDFKDRQNYPITHGICADCRVFAFGQGEETSFQSYINNLASPVVLVNDQGTVTSGNTAALGMLSKTLQQISGLPGGNVFECAYASLPQGCGRTEHCGGCTIRNAVMNTHSNGKPQSKILVKLFQRSPSGEAIATALHISTEKLGEVVLLRIDGPA